MFTSQEWGAHLDRIEPLLIDGNSIRARQAAQTFAQQFDDQTYLDTRELTQAGRDLPAIAPQQISRGIVVPPAPGDRDPAFDEQMRRFIEIGRTAIATLRQFEADLAANEGRTREHYRDAVLKYLAGKRDFVWLSEIVPALRIAPDHVDDALEQLQYEGLLDGQSERRAYLNGVFVWRVRLNPDGRALVDGTKPARPAMPTAIEINTSIINSTVSDSPFNIAGGNVSSTIALPAMPMPLQKAIDADETAALHLRALEQELNRSQPRKNIVKAAFQAVSTAVDSLNLSAEAVAHGHEWIGAATATLSHFLH
jgi:hypothetical protein